MKNTAFKVNLYDAIHEKSADFDGCHAFELIELIQSPGFIVCHP